MGNFNILKDFVNWRNVRAFICTLTVSLSFNCTWRTPHEGFLYGGLQYFVALTVANVSVALPTSFLHLTLGQLSQEDAAAVWRAVPYFKCIGYSRLLLSYIGSICTTAYLTIVIYYFLVTPTASGISYPGCTNSKSNDEKANVTEMLGSCLNETFIQPNGAKEYFVYISTIIFILSIVLVIYYWLPKIIEYISYLLGPVIIIMCMIIAFGIGDRKSFDTFNIESNWSNLFGSDIWHSALTQVLLSTQLSGGYLTLSGAFLHPSSDIRWTALLVVGLNIITSLAGLMFWFGISGEHKDTSVYAVLIQAYNTNGYAKFYLMLISAMLILSGVISMLTSLSPVYDFMRRKSIKKWKAFGMLSVYTCLFIALPMSFFRPSGLTILDYTVVPLVANFGNFYEIFAFIFFYGLKALICDVEFLTGQKLLRYWAYCWWAALSFIIIINIWWITELYSWLISSLLLSIVIIFFVVAKVSMNRHDEKFISSYRPSRNWSPRRLLTYKKTYSQEFDVAKSKSRSSGRRQSRRSSGRRRSRRPPFRPNTLSIIPEEEIPEEVEVRVEMNVIGRSNSDDVLYGRNRKAYILNRLNNEMNAREHSMSLDMNVVRDADLIIPLKETAAETDNYTSSDESIVCVGRQIINVVAIIETHE